MTAFVWPVRVYYEDTDSGGMVYHANHLRFFERARTEWLRTLGVEQDRMRWELGLVFVVHSLNVRYLKPAAFNSMLHVVTRVARHRAASLTFDQQIQSEDGATTYCEATVTVACIDAERQTPRPIPKALIAEIVHAR
ncbi:MAG: tol-pal system-associated acyl-CoA thioesterase [Ectothiorhodospiraceae bacterium]|nr:tol-pal system-associated acyl-CoA thioesterase [Ectothiorhodospiraceae bacterium]MCH8507091.1 tol-pal system-associated acyl-CoA thioesterase [Ectothiorhodospiraceae bacterium]